MWSRTTPGWASPSVNCPKFLLCNHLVNCQNSVQKASINNSKEDMLPGRSRSPSRFSFFPHRPLGQLLRKAKFYLTTRADSIAFYHSGKLDETGGRKRVCDGSPESMHGAAGAPPQLTDGACVAAQSTDVAALRHTLQARPLALRLHRERAIGAKSTDLCAVDFHVGRAQRADNRGSRMLSRTRAHRASGGPGGGRPSSPPERPWPGSGIKGGCFSVRPRCSS